MSIFKMHLQHNCYLDGFTRLFDLSGSLSIDISSDDDWQTIGDDLRSIMPDIDVHSEIREMRHKSDSP